MEKNLTREEALEKLKEIAEDIRFCMFATTDTSNFLYGRPMTTMQVDEQGDIWFFTSRESSAAQESSEQEKVCLNYANPASNNYLTVQGKASLVKDEVKMKELWNPTLKAWFPDGIDTPGIVLLRVSPEQAHYWDTDASRLQVLFSMVKSAVTGKRSDVGDHGELKLN
ncbi:MAG: pyridoxamine 5'-phosphate oxidase [Sphingobacteriales bacterium]|nr:MAG: pyridoxamine 5'-phosphate oxidase [Sphingobacteriales bacterium]